MPRALVPSARMGGGAGKEEVGNEPWPGIVWSCAPKAFGGLSSLELVMMRAHLYRGGLLCLRVSLTSSRGPTHLVPHTCLGSGGLNYKSRVWNPNTQNPRNKIGNAEGLSFECEGWGGVAKAGTARRSWSRTPHVLGLGLPTQGRFLEFQNTTFRFGVLNECVEHGTKQLLVFSTSGRAPPISDPGTKSKISFHLARNMCFKIGQPSIVNLVPGLVPTSPPLIQGSRIRF